MSHFIFSRNEQVQGFSFAFPQLPWIDFPVIRYPVDINKKQIRNIKIVIINIFNIVKFKIYIYSINNNFTND